MTSGPALPCPRCRRVLGPESWIDGESGICFECKTEYEFVAFPALRAAPAAIAPQAAVLADDSVCYFHPGNRAEAICDGCGRMLCAVCSVPFGGQKLCPACIAATKRPGTATASRSRVLYDRIAFTIALLPLVVFPATVLTAPVALGLVIYAWNRPGSLVQGRSRTRLIVAGLVALLQIAGWLTALAVWWLKKK